MSEQKNERGFLAFLQAHPIAKQFEEQHAQGQQRERVEARKRLDLLTADEERNAKKQNAAIAAATRGVEKANEALQGAIAVLAEAQRVRASATYGYDRLAGKERRFLEETAHPAIGEAIAAFWDELEKYRQEGEHLLRAEVVGRDTMAGRRDVLLWSNRAYTDRFYGGVNIFREALEGLYLRTDLTTAEAVAAEVARLRAEILGFVPLSSAEDTAGLGFTDEGRKMKVAA